MEKVKRIMLCLMIALVSACFIACGNDDDDSFGGSGNTEVPGGTVSPERTFNVEKAGTLPDKISEVDMYKIKSLKLSGVLNGTDILFLRKMMGVSEKGAATGGQLEYLDISDTKIVEGGDGYYISGGGFSYHTSYDKIGMYMFLGVRALKTILLPNGVTSIGGDVFNGCTSLTTISIPDGVTSIGDYAFNGCTSLTTISIPGSVTWIGKAAFRYSGIGAIYFTSHTPPTIHWENRNLYITYIYVPKGCKSNYENIFLSYGEIIEYDPNNK